MSEIIVTHPTMKQLFDSLTTMIAEPVRTGYEEATLCGRTIESLFEEHAKACSKIEWWQTAQNIGLGTSAVTLLTLFFYTGFFLRSGVHIILSIAVPVMIMIIVQNFTARKQQPHLDVRDRVQQQYAEFSTSLLCIIDPFKSGLTGGIHTAETILSRREMVVRQIENCGAYRRSENMRTMPAAELEKFSQKEHDWEKQLVQFDEQALKFKIVPLDPDPLADIDN